MPRRGVGHADANQSGLVAYARKLGATVQITASLDGWVDATVGFRGRNLLWEIKVPGWSAAVARGKKLTKTEQRQVDLRRTWGGTIELIETEEDVWRSLYPPPKGAGHAVS